MTRLATACAIPRRHVRPVALKIIGWHQLTSVGSTVYLRQSICDFLHQLALLFTLPLRNYTRSFLSATEQHMEPI
jgi:hypothetical protein